MSQFQLQWGIKDSLLGYLRGIEDGVIEAVVPAVFDGSHFTFGEDSAASNFDAETATGTLQFLGTAKLSGHWGMMNIVVKNPLLELEQGSGSLLIAQGGILSPETFVPFVKLESTEQPLSFRTLLTAEGRLVLGEQYQVGQELNPLTLVQV
jgi:hypothetical protein